MGHSAALIECIGVQSFDTGGDGDTGQTPAVTKRAPADGLQRRILLEGNGLQIGVSVEAELTDLGNSITYYKISNSCHVILSNPCGIGTRGRIILHHAIAVNLQRTIIKQNVLNVGAAESGIDDGCIIGALKRALFGEVTGVTQYIHLTADGYTIGIKEVDLGINRHFTSPQDACSEITICTNTLVIVETVGFCSICTNTVFTKIIVVAINLLQAGELHTVTVVGVSNPSIRRNHAVCVELSVRPFTVEKVSASSTLQHTVHKAIAVTGCRDCGAPINDGVADLAEGATGVAVLGTGCGLILHCNCIDMVGQGLGIILLCFRSMIVPAIPLQVIVTS